MKKMQNDTLSLALEGARKAEAWARPPIAPDCVKQYAMVACWLDCTGALRREYHLKQAKKVVVQYGESHTHRARRLEARRLLAQVEAAYAVEAEKRAILLSFDNGHGEVL